MYLSGCSGEATVSKGRRDAWERVMPEVAKSWEH
jgi:hypothetical protein